MPLSSEEIGYVRCWYLHELCGICDVVYFVTELFERCSMGMTLNVKI